MTVGLTVRNEYAILITRKEGLVANIEEQVASGSSMSDQVPGVRRLNINLPEPVFQELQQLSSSTGRSMTDLVRTALGLVNVAYAETNRSHVLAVADKSGKVLKQLVLP
jgi:hypothetical protein